MIAHTGSDSDSYVVLKKLPNLGTVVNLTKSDDGNIPRETFNENVNQAKKTQYIHFRCGLVPLNNSSKNTGVG